MIKPTVGRVVWFYHSKKDHQEERMLAAIVASTYSTKPNGENFILNLSVFWPNGRQFAVTEVPLIQDGQELPEKGHFATWMPFQIGQAKALAQAEGLKP